MIGVAYAPDSAAAPPIAAGAAATKPRMSATPNAIEKAALAARLLCFRITLAPFRVRVVRADLE